MSILNQEFIKRDFWYILVCMIALLGCIYTLHQGNNMINTCNEVWSEYLDTYCVCSRGYGEIINIQLNLSNDWGIYNAKDS